MFHSNLNIKYSALKGVVNSLLVWVPASFLVFPQGIEIIIVITLTNIGLGSFLGFLIEKIKK